MKYILIIASLISLNAFSQVQKPSDEMLDGDLSFKLSEEKQEESRGVASDKSDASGELKKETEPEQSKKLEYWKY